MHIRHPRAVDGDPPYVAIDVGGEHVTPNDDGTYEIPEATGGWLDRFAAANGVDAEELRVDEPDTVDWHGTEPPFDPGKCTVDELDEKLDAEIDNLSDSEVAALVEAEEAGDNRTTALDAISEHFSEAVEQHQSEGA